MHLQTSVIAALCCFAIVPARGFSSPAVKIRSFDEALTESNISKPRIRIENCSTSVPISNFYYHYYFTAENGKLPILEDYYTPSSIPALESLGGGEYRIRFTFTGITLLPGQTLPNSSGEVVGIHYSDWSPIDKSNDFSNNLSNTFILNPNIPVYLHDGTRIYGNLPDDPDDPPMPPPVFAATGEFAVFSKEYTDLRDRVKITGGSAGSSNYLELGCDDTLYGSVLSRGAVFLRERARVYGDVSAGGTINKQNGGYIQGTERFNAQMILPELQTPTVTEGTPDVSVPPHNAYTLVPGAYGSFHAYANATITITAGEYSFGEFILEPHVTLLLTPGAGHVEILVKDMCRLGNNTVMTFSTGTPVPYSVSIKSAQCEQFYIGTESQIAGLIYAPDAEVHVYSRTTIAGSVFGKRVIIEPDANVCKPPTLLNLSHSEGAMAPPFNPVVFEYVAVVPDVTSTIMVYPEIKSGQSVTVNGDDPENPVELTAPETDIVMLLTHPEACGTTQYRLKVKKSADYMIFVDPESPCSTGTETGLSWKMAYKTLEAAMVDAAKTGKAILLKEGVYIPARRIDTTDARSATFTISSGIEIIGGFLGTETDDKPLGSVYNTILSGDVNGDDTAFTSWPPGGGDTQYVDDNLYHVLTIDGSYKGRDVRISNVVVSGGYANRDGDDFGAGIFIKSGTPHLEFVGIVNNYAKSHGAGVYVSTTGGIDTVKNCLFQNNCSQTGDGGGLYYGSTAPLVIDASVFDHNMTLDTVEQHGGCALYTRSASAKVVNSVFSQNTSGSLRGAVVNDGGSMYILNSTFAFNAGKGAVSIFNANDGSTGILNSILWNTSGKDEVDGEGFIINHTCITKGYVGEDNLSVDPKFRNVSQPAGKNGKWGDYDDGLRLKESSPCIDEAKGGAPPEDILTTPRYEWYWCDLGAYEYVLIMDDADGLFGIRFGDGEFLVDKDTYCYHPFKDKWGKKLATRSRNARYIRALVPINKHTTGKNTLFIKLYVTDRKNIIPDISVREIILERDGRLAEQYVYYSIKPIVFVKSKEYVNHYSTVDDEEAYFIYGSTEGIGYRLVLPGSQF